MTTEWKPISRLDYNDSIKQIHCDTRDFCAYTDTDVYSQLPNMSTISAKHKEKFFFTIDEIKKVLLETKENSGGEKKWRFLAFIGMEKSQLHSWDLKYLRFYWTENGWVCFSRSG